MIQQRIKGHAAFLGLPEESRSFVVDEAHY